MSEQNSHQCVLCNTKLETKELLQDHFRKHANKEIDNKGRPVTHKDFMQHVSTARSKALASTSGKPSNVICDVCSQEFRTVTAAIQHKFRKHPASVAKHFCPHCGMQFPLKDNCDRHVLIHREEANHSSTCSCPDCGVVFYNKMALDYHFKSTHKRITALFQPVATPPPSKKIRMNNAGEPQSVYYCHLCGYEYIVKFNLQKHLERQHTQKERDSVPMDMIKCTTCDALFYNKKAYDNHNMYHKPEDLYVTSEEQRLQTVKRVDQDFDIRRVQTTVDKFVPLNRVRTRPSATKKQRHNLVAPENLEPQHGTLCLATEGSHCTATILDVGLRDQHARVPAVELNGTQEELILGQPWLQEVESIIKTHHAVKEQCSDAEWSPVTSASSSSDTDGDVPLNCDGEKKKRKKKQPSA